MATNSAGSVARELSLQAVHYFRKTVNYNDADIASGVKFGVLPAGAQLIGVIVNVETAFNAGTTNVLTVGTNASDWNNVVDSDDTAETAGGSALITTGTGLEFTADTSIYVKYAQTGTAASTGKAHIVVMYVPDNDQ